MKHYNMKKARKAMIAMLDAIDPGAAEFVDWDLFEQTLDHCWTVHPNPPKEAILVVFSTPATAARRMKAMATGLAN